MNQRCKCGRWIGHESCVCVKHSTIRKAVESQNIAYLIAQGVHEVVDRGRRVAEVCHMEESK